MERETQSVQIQVGEQKYMFDGVIKVIHQSALRIHDDPANAKGEKYTNSAAIEPDRVVMDILMSDAVGTLDDFTTGSPSRTFSAYQKLKELQRGRELFTLHTRLHVYENMLIESISAAEYAEYAYGMVATVVYKHQMNPPAPAKKGDRPPPKDNGNKEKERGGSMGIGGGNPNVYVLQ